MGALILEKDKLNELLQNIEDLKNIYSSIIDSKVSNEEKLLYTNKEVLTMLDVGDKLLRQYRKNGLIGYSKIGDKFFYQEKDIVEFLNNHYHKSYAYEYK